MNLTNISNELLFSIIFRLKENIPRIEKCLNELSEEEIWKKPNSSSNSIGNLILHVCGNITQYIISALGGKEDNRQRNMEFSITQGYNSGELINKITATINEATGIIKNLTDEEILKIRIVQGREQSGINILIHVTEHFSYHTGQIAFLTKMFKDKDLGFYKGKNLNKKNII